MLAFLIPPVGFVSANEGKQRGKYWREAGRLFYVLKHYPRMTYLWAPGTNNEESVFFWLSLVLPAE